MAERDAESHNSEDAADDSEDLDPTVEENDEIFESENLHKAPINFNCDNEHSHQEMSDPDGNVNQDHNGWNKSLDSDKVSND